MLIYKSDLYVLRKIPSYVYLVIFIILWLLKSYIYIYIYDCSIYKIYILIISFFINIEGSIMAFIILGRIAEVLK